MTNRNPCQSLLRLVTNHNLRLIGIPMQTSTIIHRAPWYSRLGLLVLVAAEQSICGEGIKDRSDAWKVLAVRL